MYTLRSINPKNENRYSYLRQVWGSSFFLVVVNEREFSERLSKKNSHRNASITPTDLPFIFSYTSLLARFVVCHLCVYLSWNKKKRNESRTWFINEFSAISCNLGVVSYCWLTKKIKIDRANAVVQVMMKIACLVRGFVRIFLCLLIMNASKGFGADLIVHWIFLSNLWLWFFF